MPPPTSEEIEKFKIKARNKKESSGTLITESDRDLFLNYPEKSDQNIKNYEKIQEEKRRKADEEARAEGG